MSPRDKHPSVQETTIRLPRKMHDRLRKVAFVERRPMNEIIQEALQTFLEGQHTRGSAPAHAAPEIESGARPAETQAGETGA